MLEFELKNDTIVLTGNTFPIKDKIKQAGGRWNPNVKCWQMINNKESLSILSSMGFVSKNNSDLSHSVQKIPELNPESILSLSVSELLRLLDGVIRNYFSCQYWISGEISSLKSSNHHLFFELIEKQNGSESTSLRTQSISCVLWAGKRKLLQDKLDNIPLADGLEIKVLISVDFRKDGGRITCIINDIDTGHTLGHLLLQRQQIIKELKKRSLYDKNRTTVLSSLPLKVALLTAENSRACSDFLDEIKLSKISFELSLFNVNMQGENTARDIISSLNKIAQMPAKSIDIIVITRGGGSRLDLRWFDDLEIAKAIAYTNIPVLTAVGHFEDISIADEVAFHAEKTPTAAARFLSEKVLNTYQKLSQQIENIGRLLQRRIEKEMQRINILCQRIEQSIQNKISREKAQIEQLESIVKVFKTTTKQSLLRGFALLYDKNGTILTGKNFIEGQYSNELTIKLAYRRSNDDCIIKDIYVNVRVENVEAPAFVTLKDTSSHVK